MTIDLDRCTGCQACVIACRTENNVSINGADEAEKGRAHYWIRVERYWEGEYPNLKARFMPIPCQQCQSAPCETVCPVYASVHDFDDKLNAQVYNRCVGTFYCSNNCPYYVRFFNWFDYPRPEAFKEQLNPDVTVRTRGVMEKCTFCIQRIRKARVLAYEGQDDVNTRAELILPDGAVQPACVQTCPTGALQFGDIRDPDSRVSQLAGSGRRFHLLEELGTEPAVIYLKEL
jgi:molybdopterin-containing oxidoreductase family iron-sulfur binding subunit